MAVRSSPKGHVALQGGFDHGCTGPRRLHPQHRRSAMAGISQSFWRGAVETAGDAGNGRRAPSRLPHLDVPADGICRAPQAPGTGAGLSRAGRRGADGDLRPEPRRAQARFHLPAARRRARHLQHRSGRSGVSGDHVAGDGWRDASRRRGGSRTGTMRPERIVLQIERSGSNVGGAALVHGAGSGNAMRDGLAR
jgi:hypothetical protein